MKSKLLGVIVMMTLVACGQSQAPETASAKADAPLTSGLVLENMDKSVHPGDDFFTYMNGAWIDQTEIPADRSDYGGFGILLFPV